MGGKIKLCHGTCREAASSIYKNGIKFNVGSGELGQGFYMSTSLAYASCMAWHKMNSNSNGQNDKFFVLSAEIDVDDMKQWHVKSLSDKQAASMWKKLRESNETDKKAFDCDIVVSPIQDGLNMGSWQFVFPDNEGGNRTNLSIAVERMYEGK